MSRERHADSIADPFVVASWALHERITHVGFALGACHDLNRKDRARQLPRRLQHGGVLDVDSLFYVETTNEAILEQIGTRRPIDRKPPQPFRQTAEEGMQALEIIRILCRQARIEHAEWSPVVERYSALMERSHALTVHGKSTYEMLVTDEGCTDAGPVNITTNLIQEVGWVCGQLSILQNAVARAAQFAAPERDSESEPGKLSPTSYRQVLDRNPDGTKQGEWEKTSADTYADRSADPDFRPGPHPRRY